MRAQEICVHSLVMPVRRTVSGCTLDDTRRTVIGFDSGLHNVAEALCLLPYHDVVFIFSHGPFSDMDDRGIRLAAPSTPSTSRITQSSSVPRRLSRTWSQAHIPDSGA